ncbi:glutamate--tRNA ligase [Proteiniclasticum sp. QWL-01]|uniref:glutamate--tRNA ligase n=1 Tax=Proteiniclasticum sp. QWL-01 TaxID=3036945 RepID=UPI00240F0413|nr:glutamate--tRNA ligase [Proteiniclasticum sp. QWL-01]WFF71580.1 glutamate--tRNA ligase [Proteiniclasticum sp. QWL-01]
MLGVGNMKIRTRFAPSPTGYMHIGNLRTALYEYLIAKHEGGDFILRIEDTDQERFVEGSVDVVLNSLEKSGLHYDEGPDKDKGYGPYIQSERRPIYKKYAEELVEKGEAYYCFCDKERLDTLRAHSEALKRPFKYDKHCLHLTKEEIAEKLASGMPYVIRQNNPTEGETVFEDAIYGKITVDNQELEDMVLLKSDGLPTYNFANVVDDHLMEISHVVRGSEYLSSAPKYNRLYEAFGWDIPIYVHCPPIMKDAQNKLSKRSGDASFQDLLDKGYLPEAVLNYIALLGWNPGTNDEIFSLEDLIRVFDYHKINKSPAIFDNAKLRWMNQQYLKAMDAETFHAVVLPWIEQVTAGTELDTRKIAAVLHERTEVLSEIPGQIEFLKELPVYDTAMHVHKKMKTTPEIALTSLQKALPVLELLPEWDYQRIHDALMGLAQEMGIKNGQMLWPVRTALSGMQYTPGGAFEIADILGREESLRRLNIGIKLLEEAILSV